MSACPTCKAKLPGPPMSLASSLEMALRKAGETKYLGEKVLGLTLAVQTAIDVIKGRCFKCRKREMTK